MQPNRIDTPAIVGYLPRSFRANIANEAENVMHRQPLRLGWLWAASCLACLSGCVERRFVITTDPPGAIVLNEKHKPMGASPADEQFVYYGKYKFTVIKDGFQTQTIEEQVKAPWYEYFPFEFFSENLIPWTIRDVRRLHYTLVPSQLIPPEEVLGNGTILRERERGLQVPPRPDELAPAPRPAPVMPSAR